MNVDEENNIVQTINMDAMQELLDGVQDSPVDKKRALGEKPAEGAEGAKVEPEVQND